MYNTYCSFHELSTVFRVARDAVRAASRLLLRLNSCHAGTLVSQQFIAAIRYQRPPVENIDYSLHHSLEVISPSPHNIEAPRADCSIHGLDQRRFAVLFLFVRRASPSLVTGGDVILRFQ